MALEPVPTSLTPWQPLPRPPACLKAAAEEAGMGATGAWRVHRGGGERVFQGKRSILSSHATPCQISPYGNVQRYLSLSGYCYSCRSSSLALGFLLAKGEAAVHFCCPTPQTQSHKYLLVLQSVKGEERAVCHFYRSNTACQAMHEHLAVLATKHMETKFMKIQAEKAPFLTGRWGAE